MNEEKYMECNTYNDSKYYARRDDYRDRNNGSTGRRPGRATG